MRLSALIENPVVHPYRAMKQATSDTVTHDHLVRLSHMFRRVAAPSSSSSGGASGRPHVMAQQSASHPRRLRPQSATADLCAWVPRSAGSSEHRWEQQQATGRAFCCMEARQNSRNSLAMHGKQSRWLLLASFKQFKHLASNC